MNPSASPTPPRPRAERAGADREAAAPPLQADAQTGSRRAVVAVPADREADAHQLGEPVATIAGDRTCVDCGFNLIGQVVRKEPTYGLFLVRCPECGRAAAVEEHPRLGRIGRRLTALFAALWVGALTIAVFAVGGAMGGMSVGAAINAGETFGAFVHDAYADSPEGAAQAAAEGRERVAPWMFGAQWWEAQDQNALFAQWGGVREALWLASFLLAPATLGAFVVGVILACLLLHVRRWRLTLAPVLPIAFAAAIAAISWFIQTQQFNPSAGAYDAGIAYLFWRVAGSALASLYVAMAIGAVAGRPIARALVRALLPPRLRNSLSLLWSADGLDPRGAGGWTQRRAAGATRCR